MPWGIGVAAARTVHVCVVGDRWDELFGPSGRDAVSGAEGGFSSSREPTTQPDENVSERRMPPQALLEKGPDGESLPEESRHAEPRLPCSSRPMRYCGPRDGRSIG